MEQHAKLLEVWRNVNVISRALLPELQSVAQIYKLMTTNVKWTKQRALQRKISVSLWETSAVSFFTFKMLCEDDLVLLLKET